MRCSTGLARRALSSRLLIALTAIVALGSFCAAQAQHLHALRAGAVTLTHAAANIDVALADSSGSPDSGSSPSSRLPDSDPTKSSSSHDELCVLCTLVVAVVVFGLAWLSSASGRRVPRARAYACSFKSFLWASPKGRAPPTAAHLA